MKKLDNACVALCVESIDNTSSELENAIYEMSKKITILIGSNNFRGEAADNAKAYLQDAAMNIVAGSLNVLQELTDAADEMKKIFLDYESDAEGVVSEKRLTTVQNDLANTYKAGFDDILSEISPILTKAANYISTTSLSSKDVKDAYDDGDTHLTKMNENLSTADTDAKKKLDDVLAHLFNLRAMIQSYAGTRNNEGDIDYSKVASLTTYYKEDSKNLDAKRKNDPFSYHAGTVSAWEVEGGIGRKKDLYAYGGNQVFTAGGMVQTHDLSVKTKGEASVAALYGGF